jgi:hypothetical protein
MFFLLKEATFRDINNSFERFLKYSPHRHIFYIQVEDRNVYHPTPKAEATFRKMNNSSQYFLKYPLHQKIFDIKAVDLTVY